MVSRIRGLLTLGGAASATPTMFRLVSPFGESGGRFVHISFSVQIIIFYNLTSKSAFVVRFSRESVKDGVSFLSWL